MKHYKFITRWSDFMLNETLISHNIDYVFKDISLNMTDDVNFDIIKNDNMIELKLYDFNTIKYIKLFIDVLNNIFIDRNGWFPSSLKLLNLKNMENIIKYNNEYIIKNQSKLKNVTITYESKYDIEQNIPDKLYHLSIKNYKNNIIKNGLCPKSKNKKSIHLDRIYVCIVPGNCYNLITQMKIDYKVYIDKNSLNKINYEWILYEIDSTELNIKLYKDPKYKNKGYYVVDNISPKLISIYDQE